MRPPRLLAAALALAGCATSAPHTAAAVGLNTGLALGVAAAGRAAGGCWAICTDGRVCNPASGWCERPPPTLELACPPGAPAGDLRCGTWLSPTIQQRLPAPTGGLVVSPATGSVPPPPADASPGGPPQP